MGRIWMPFYPGDYLADTVDLTAEQHGIYIILLMIAWRRPNCTLPDDMEWMKRALTSCASDMHGNRFNRSVPYLLNRFFLKDSEGNWYQNRLRNEREKSDKISEKQREKSNKRWSKINENKDIEDASALPNDNATAMPYITQHNIKEESKRESKKERKKNSSADALDPKYVFEEGIIRLNQKDFDKWTEAFSNLELRSELMGLSQWAAQQDNWYHAVLGALTKRNRKAVEAKSAPKVFDYYDPKTGYGDDHW